ncbi:hypothetical protein F5050DRAFT_1752644 [Lentinula boryana]|uniref:Uncharacterized protein n=1 Tax=Lentinula boryana TaxID=40481 RepID=A0ABQ8QFW8_9AGAR|nr:hypothetical protein F5050DRAFT_1752644 [Lentinula boryana]
MSKSNGNATLRYIKRQTRRLTNSVNSLIGGRRDLDSSAVLTQYDGGRFLNEREASSPDGDDNGTSRDVSSSSDDDCGDNFTEDSTEPDAVSMLLQSSEDEKNTNSPDNCDASVNHPAMIAVSMQSPVVHVTQTTSPSDNLIFTGSPVVTKDFDLKNGSTPSGFHPPSTPIARLTPSEEVPEDTTYVYSKVHVVPVPGSSQLSAMAVARGEAHITGSSDMLPAPSEYIAPSTQAAASSPFQYAGAAFVGSSVPASSTANASDPHPTIDFNTANSDSPSNAIAEPGLTSNSIVSSDASSSSSSADSSSRSDVATSICIAQSASSRLDIPSVTTAASPPSNFGTIPSRLPSHKPPSLVPSTSDLPSNKNRVRTLREIARLPAFYGSNDYVRMNWKKEYGAYEGHTSLPTWDSAHKQWQHSRNRDIRPPVVVSSVDPLIGRVTISIPAPAHAAPVHVPSSPSTPAVSDVEGGSPSLESQILSKEREKSRLPVDIVQQRMSKMRCWALHRLLKNQALVFDGALESRAYPLLQLLARGLLLFLSQCLPLRSRILLRHLRLHRVNAQERLMKMRREALQMKILQERRVSGTRVVVLQRRPLGEVSGSASNASPFTVQHIPLFRYGQFYLVVPIFFSVAITLYIVRLPLHYRCFAY